MSGEREVSVAQLLAALGQAHAAPACDYYGREIVDGDALRVAPWATFGAPQACLGVDLSVLGQTVDGMVVVAAGDGAATPLPQEMTVIVSRDGAPLDVAQSEWWANLLAAQQTSQVFAVDVGALPVRRDSSQGADS